ncbi:MULTISPECIES: OmpA family protein [Calditerrivibrio]|uniref:OmpA-like domain-containing protein n=1 Tax=Calditerrivibrio nitroreducens TaxID=477976 RepID=A0A2J6WNG7_9BACT|nr:MAG: hypothetical protein C0187_03080 [Calditerrivibrio nitroreducens]
MTPLTLFAISTAIVITLGSIKENKSDKICLLADDDGKIGKVIVKNETTEKLIDKEKYLIEIKDNKIADPIKIDEKEFEKRFGNLLKAEAQRPKTFILYFETGSDKLTEESSNMIKEIINEIKNRENPELEIIGHTDSVGEKEANYMLGLKRAESVKNILTSQGVETGMEIELSSLGEDNPLIQTPDETPEPKNRRVEVIVK